MSNASRDQNRVPTLIGVSSSGFQVPETVAVDPTTHRMLVTATGTVSLSGQDILAGYTQARIDLSGDPLYIGYENETNYIIKSVDFTTGEVGYYAGSGDVGAAWGGRAGYIYVEANTLY